MMWPMWRMDLALLMALVIPIAVFLWGAYRIIKRYRPPPRTT